MCMASFAGYAQTTDEQPSIIIKTNLYDLFGPQNDFVIYMGMTSTDYIDIDGGYGKVEVEVTPATFDFETNSIKATQVACRVSDKGEVRIYGDASKIDYLDFEGTYIRTIDMAKVTNLEILNMDHNELESLDLSPFSKLQSISVNDNPFSVSPLHIGGNKPELTILSMDIVGALSSDFNVSDYPNLVSFTAYANKGLKSLDPTGCPKLRQISIDSTDVGYLDLSKNPLLEILNISDTRVQSVDLSTCPKLREFYCQHQGVNNSDIKLTSIDVSCTPELVYLYCAGNLLTELDLSGNPQLMMLGAGHNLLTGLDLSKNTNLFEVNISYNRMDFATMPMNPGTWHDYICEQEPLPVALSYPVGATIDLSERVLRQGYTTTARLMQQSTSDPNNLTPLDDSFYSFDNGKLTLKKEVPDSVYVEYFNTAFENTSLQTTKFMVKTASEYGKPSMTTEFTTADSPGATLNLRIGVAGASATSPRSVYVDFGDGQLKEYSITTSELPLTANVSGAIAGYGNKKIYVNDGVYVSALGLNTSLYSLDVSRMSALTDLDVSGAGLYMLDLTLNRRLARLDASSNNFSQLDLAGVNGAFHKVNLGYINLSNNRLTSFEVPDNRTLIDVNLSNNEISELMLRDADYLQSLNVAGNNLTELDIHYSAGLKNLDVSDNELSNIVFAPGTSLNTLSVQNNNFTFANLPRRSDIPVVNYTYAPQHIVPVPTIGPGINMSAQNVTIDGHSTNYALYKTGGSLCTPGTDYTVDEGRVRFVNTTMGKVYCQMTNAAYPDLYLRTGEIEAAGMPTNLLATFQTPVGGENVTLSLAAVSGTPAIYFDWSGNGYLDQYMLKDTYTLYSAETVEGATVKVYTYNDEEKISVFSITGATMSSMDGSRLKDCTAFTISGAGLNSISLPDNAALRELTLEGNNFSEIDLSKYNNLYTLGLNDNKFTSFDVTGYPNLGLLSIANNDLTEITVTPTDNKNLWYLNLNGNAFESVAFENIPDLEQLYMSNNKLTSVDVSKLQGLKALSLDGNCLNFKTLPTPRQSWLSFNYANQAAIKATADAERRVDLSFNKESASGVATEYRWYLGIPSFDEEGNLVGEELYIDDEYTLDGGVTTFLGDFSGLVCVMTNSEFPRLYMTTYEMNVSGVEDVYSSSDVSVSVTDGTIEVSGPEGMQTALYGINGTQHGVQKISGGKAAYGNLQKGIYILTTQAGSYKVMVK